MDHALTCERCGCAFRGHLNSKRCPPCRRKFPCIPTFTAEQERTARRWAGKIYGRELAEKVGVSLPTLKRWARAHGVSTNALAYKPDVIRRVCAYYLRHGKAKTAKRFPDVKVRSIVERYLAGLTTERREIRWTDEQLVRAAKLAGLVSHDEMARYFNRPNAHRGSITSLWAKRFRMGGGNLNGLAWDVAKHLVVNYAPATKTTHGKGGAWRVLWVHVEAFLKPGVPEHLRQAISALANFQRWLHGSRYPQVKIERLLEEVKGCRRKSPVSRTRSSIHARSSRLWRAS
jgi:hypothetical protein